MEPVEPRTAIFFTPLILLGCGGIYLGEGEFVGPAGLTIAAKAGGPEWVYGTAEAVPLRDLGLAEGEKDATLGVRAEGAWEVERKVRARTGGSRFLAALGMTISFRNCQRKAKEGSDPCGMTARKATAEAEAKAKAMQMQMRGSFAALRMTAKNLQGQQRGQKQRRRQTKSKCAPVDRGTLLVG
jgi:hypothetical protein